MVGEWRGDDASAKRDLKGVQRVAKGLLKVCCASGRCREARDFETSAANMGLFVSIFSNSRPLFSLYLGAGDTIPPGSFQRKVLKPTTSY